MTDRLTLPFSRGQSPDNTTTNHDHLLGTEYTVLDDQFNTNREVTLRLVLNGSTIAFDAKKGVAFKTSGDYQTVVDGYSRTEAAPVAGFVDDKHTATTVAVNDYFYIATKGPHLCLTPSTAAAAGPVDYAVGATLVAATAAASTQTTDAGCVATRNATLSATGTALALNLENAVGRAATARATTATATNILVILGK